MKLQSPVQPLVLLLLHSQGSTIDHAPYTLHSISIWSDKYCLLKARKTVGAGQDN